MYDYSRYICVTNRHLYRDAGGSECTIDEYLQHIKRISALHPFAIILREKDMEDEEYCELAKRVMDICDKERGLIYVHSNINAAKQSGCNNIHFSIGELERVYREDMHILDTFENISVSCHSMEEVKEAVSMGVSLIVLGTIFETQCKPGLIGKGLDYVREICQYVKGENQDIRVFAIGGINPGNINRVIEAGADGGCMMSWFMQNK